MNFRRARSLPAAAQESVNERDKTEIESLINNIRNGSSTQTRPELETDYNDPFYDAPPVVGVGSSESESIRSDDDLDAFPESDALLNVNIHSSIEGSNFYIPVSLMVEREQTMRGTAKQFGIGADRWGDSLLYREWRNTRDDASSALEERAHVQSNGDVTVDLHPERDCARSNHSHTLEWKPWLTTCIRAFYNTGTVRIPDDCIGSDILLALEYFGIVYTPDQLVFDSFGAYLRVKMWSEYFTHRSTLAQWVVKRLLNTNSKHSHTFVTSPSMDEGDLLVGSKRADVLDGNLQLDPSKFAGIPCCAVVHDFFHDEDKPEGVDLPLDALMREDFAYYVQNSLPGTKVDFSLKQVEVLRSGKTVKRATLHINFISTSPPVPQPTVSKTIIAEKKQGPPPQIREKLPFPRSRSKSPSLFKRMGSGLLKSKGSVDDATESYEKLDKIQPAPSSVSRQILVRTQSTPSSEPKKKFVGIQSAPSVDHIYDESQQKTMRNKANKGEAVVSADQVYSELGIKLDQVYTELEEKFKSSTPPYEEEGKIIEQASAAPYDEKRNTKDKVIAPSPSVAPSDEQQLGYYYRAPVKSIWEGDQVTVASGLTSPFREDESTVKSIGIANTTASEPILPASKRSPTNKSTSPRSALAPNKMLGSIQNAVVEDQLEPFDCIQKILEEEETEAETNSNFFSSGYTSGTSTRIDSIPMSSQGPQCGGAEIVNSTMSYLFGSKLTKKPRVVKRPKLPTHPRSKSSQADLDAESLAGRGTSALSAIECFLPEVDLQTKADDKSDIEDLAGRETLESSAAAWLRNTINFNQFIYDDPVPENDDEYLRLARQAGAGTPRHKAKEPEKAGTLVKEILDGLMASDNSSLFDGSMASASVSTRSASAYSLSTGVSSQKPLTKDSYVPFGQASIRSAGAPNLQSSEESLKGSANFEPRALPSGHTPPTDPRCTVPRRRFPAPIRSLNKVPPRSPKRITKDESRNGTPTKQRAMSPLARIPAMLPGRRRGKKEEDNSEVTPQIKNGIKVTSVEETDVNDRRKSPSRIAGLFRSKGLVRRRSMGEDKGQPSRSSVASEEYKLFKGKLYNI